MKATLNFNSIELAKKFTKEWACKTLTGHDMSAVKSNGSVDVTVYDLNDEKIAFIENFVELNK